MHDHDTYDYAVIRVVPRVEREEFVNVGVVVSCPARDFLEARIEFDPARVLALDPAADIESISAHLAAIPPRWQVLHRLPTMVFFDAGKTS